MAEKGISRKSQNNSNKTEESEAKKNRDGKHTYFSFWPHHHQLFKTSKFRANLQVYMGQGTRKPVFGLYKKVILIILRPIYDMEVICIGNKLCIILKSCVSHS